jgi:hypothetical protein
MLMMGKIRFLSDYRGVLTDETFYHAGDVAELQAAAALVEAGRAEYIPNISQDEPDEVVLKVDIEDMPVGELKRMARIAGVEGYRKMKKAELVESLSHD